jgi:branched-chain amino acid aminotransferase
MSYFIYNGKILKDGIAVIGPGNRGLRYGDGLFETMRVKDGRVLFAEDHFNRLWQGLKVLGFELPLDISKDVLKEQISVLLKKNKCERSARLRLSMIRGDGGLCDAVNHRPAYIIQAWPLDDHVGEWNVNGLVMGIQEEVKKSCDILANIKSNNFLPYVMAALYAKRKQWNDAVVINSSGRIADTTIANIFIIKGENISTPHLKEGCVAGIMRQALIRYLLENNWAITEREISVEDLLSADEVFVTNSIQNIRWVQSIHETSYINAVTKKLYTSFIPTIS